VIVMKLLSVHRIMLLLLKTSQLILT